MSPAFPPAGRPRSLRRHVEEALSAAIISGELAPGTLVTVPSLAAEFKVSATPVREAMLDLEKRGFVESVRNKGFRVTAVSEKDLLEIVQVRQMLEGPAMSAVSSLFPQSDLPAFRLLADRIVSGAAAGDLTSYLAADLEFHLSLLELLENRRLLTLVAEMRSQTRMIGLADMINSPELADSAQEHHQMLDLLVEGRGPELQMLVHRHIGHVAGWWSGHPERAEDPSEQRARQRRAEVKTGTESTS